FKTGGHGLQFGTDKMWISELGIHYKLGVDGLNLFLIALATLLFSATLLWSAQKTWARERTYYLHLGIAGSAVLGALTAQDLILFVAFFDLMLIPFFFLTGIWGPPTRTDRIPAVTKLVIYTLVGSLLMLAAAIATGVLVASQSGNHIDFAFSALRAN